MICPWEPENARRIIRILRCFFLTYRLKINLLKSNLIRVGVPDSLVQNVVLAIGWQTSSLPFTHLGVPVGRCMAHISSWLGLMDQS